jgi:hypothetical protein
MTRSILFSLISLSFFSCMQVKEVGLFEEPSKERNLPNVNGFYAVNILKDQISSEVWVTEQSSCIQLKQEQSVVANGEGAFYLKWDKPEGGCDWIGMGIGWDNWSAKDLSGILNEAAIQFKAKGMNGPIRSLPLAVSLEDYTGNGAWLGLFSEFITQQENDSWATVTLPLERFGWNEFGANPGNIKQMIIQFEAAGEVYIDEVQIVPYRGLLNQQYMAVYSEQGSFKVDGLLDDWEQLPALALNEHTIKLSADGEQLYISGVIKDASPMKNNLSGSDLLKADGIELALSLNPEALTFRSKMLLSDQHLFIAASNEGAVYDLKNGATPIASAELKFNTTEKGYRFECAIPLSHFPITSIKTEANYQFEVGVIASDLNEGKPQQRWNSPSRNEFPTNPSLWGTLSFHKSDER